MILSADTNYAPQSWLDEDTGELMGFDIEVAQGVGEVLGLDVEVRTAQWEKITPAFKRASRLHDRNGRA